MVTLGPALYTAIEVPKISKSDSGFSAEVIDLVPPTAELRAAGGVGKKTGKVLLVCDAVEAAGCVMQTVAANLTQSASTIWTAPGGGRLENWITPRTGVLEALFFPQPAWLLERLHERILPLKGYQPQTNQTLGELVRRSRLGV